MILLMSKESSEEDHPEALRQTIEKQHGYPEEEELSPLIAKDSFLCP
jgi:hypothetical protein